MSDEQQSKDKWIEKKKPILANLTEAICSEEEALRDMTKATANIDETKAITIDDLTRLHQMKQIYESNAYLHDNPATAGSVNMLNGLSNFEKESASSIASIAKVLRGNTDILKGTVLTSGSLVVSLASDTAYLTDRMIDTEPITNVIKMIKKPTARARQFELTPKLHEIEPRLAIKLNGAWQTLIDTSNVDRFSQGANSARELISDLLIILAPEDKVILMNWFKVETKDGRPSQRQRAKYAALGSNDSLSDDVLKPIDALSNNIRNSYEELNPIAHLRDYSVDLQLLTESIIDNVQIYLLKLLELHSIYFKE